ncbi:MAG: glycosyltransferase [Actinomycetota bacterium]|nr:glycosyltransferase [Actinomycetota bacterium]MDA8167067.1 glycosyltransferase [Actinomycetota bacterium]
MILLESWFRRSDKVTVTTSWDDGHVMDFRVADLLDRYGLQGTFYISPSAREIDPGARLDAGQITLLGQRFELGAHTFSHPDLTAISHDQAISEITRGADVLEEVSGTRPTSFCYPYGKFSRRLSRSLGGLGFTYARTVRQFETGITDPLTAGTTVHAYQHRTGLSGYLRATGFNPARAARFLDWSLVAADLFDVCVKNGGIFHLWGHSWEIDAHGDWDKLEQVFAYIAGHKQADYVANCSLGRPLRTSLLLASSYFPPKAGGLEHYAFEMAKGAARAGVEVNVITSGTSQQLEHEQSPEGMVIHRLPVQFKIKDTPLNIRWLLDIRRLVRDINPDVINIHLPVPFLADLVALFSRGAPVIVTYHCGSMKGNGFVLDRLVDLYERLILPLALNKARRIVCTSEYVRQGFLKRFTGKSVTINPGVDTSMFTKRDNRPNGKSVIFVGDFRTGRKGLDHLREAIRLVPGTTLHVVGRGPQIDSPGTVYYGELHGKDLVARIHASQVLVLPSDWPEAFGMVLLEAMACGVPVIGTDIGGISEVIRNREDGLLVAPGSAKALADAISYIINNPGEAEEYAAKAYKKVMTSYRWEKIIEKYRAELSDITELKMTKPA